MSRAPSVCPPPTPLARSAAFRPNQRGWLTLLLSLAGQFAGADSLDTLDGKSFTGKVSLAAEAFLIRQADDAVARVPLAQVRLVTFLRAASIVVAPVPANWQMANIGSASASGQFVETNGAIQVSTIGTVSRVDDGHQFVWRNVGDLAELIAFVPPQITERRDGERYKSAGLEIRARLDGDGPCYRLFSEAGRTGMTQWRLATGKEHSKSTPIPQQGVWLRLQRCGQQVTAYTSAEGRVWQQVGNEMIPLPEQAHFGLLLAGSKKGSSCTVAFTHVALHHEGTPPIAPPQLLLRDGGVLTGRFLGSDGSVVRWAGLGREWSVSLVNVSRLLLQPGAESRLAEKGAGRPGALLASGDFVDGDLTAGEPGRIAISSVLFGLRTYAAESSVLGVHLHAVDGTGGEFEIQCQDGSRLLADQVELRAEGLAGRERGAGKFLLPLTDVKELRRMTPGK